MITVLQLVFIASLTAIVVSIVMSSIHERKEKLLRLELAVQTALYAIYRADCTSDAERDYIKIEHFNKVSKLSSEFSREADARWAETMCKQVRNSFHAKFVKDESLVKRYQKYRRWTHELCKVDTCPEHEGSLRAQLLNAALVSDRFGFTLAAKHLRAEANGRVIEQQINS